MAKAQTFQARFGTYSKRGEVRSVGIKIDWAEGRVNQMEELCCGSRVQCALCSDPQGNGDTEGQGTLVDTALNHESTADIKRYSSDGKRFSFTITFNPDEVDDAVLCAISQTSGTLTLKKLGVIPSKRGKAEAEEE